MASEVTPRDRVMAAFAFQETDRVPVVPLTTAYAIRYAGLPMGKTLWDVDSYVHAQVTCSREHGFDGVFGLGTIDAIAEALGAEVAVYEDGIPVVRRHPLQNPDELDRLRAVDLMHQPAIELRRQVVLGLRRAAPELAIFASVRAPFNTASQIRGVQAFYKDLIRRPAFVHHLMEFCTQRCTVQALELAEAGADVLWIGNSVSNAMCISRRHYEEFSSPYTARMIAALRARGAKTLVHTCGRWDDRMDVAAREGASGWHISDFTDLAEAKAEYGHSMCLMGNISSVALLLEGTPSAVERASAEAIAAARRGGGFILSSDCGVSPDSPVENVQAMVHAARALDNNGDQCT